VRFVRVRLCFLVRVVFVVVYRLRLVVWVVRKVIVLEVSWCGFCY